MNELPEVNKPLRALIASLENLGALVTYVDGLKSAINDEPALRARVASLHDRVTNESLRLAKATEALEAVEADLANARRAHAADIAHMDAEFASRRDEEKADHEALMARSRAEMSKVGREREELARITSIEKTALATLLKEQDVVKARISKMKSSVLDAMNGV